MFGLVAALVLATPGAPLTALGVENPRVVVFSKTAAFRHDSIPDACAALRKMGESGHFRATFTEDAAEFVAKLKSSDVAVFLMTTGDVLDAAQQRAFESWYRSGGGYVGVHAASDTEYDWPWYGRLVGAYFAGHPAQQDAVVRIEDRAHPSTAHLPLEWKRWDEWYNFRSNPRSAVRVLASLDESTYKGGTMGDHPATWCHESDGGRSWYTALGHTKESYAEAPFVESLTQGILWAAQTRPRAGAGRLRLPKTGGWTATDGVWSNSRGAKELVSSDTFGDQWLHVEFKIPKGSNSGVYIQGRYEIQILDSYGKPDAEMRTSDCGGIYQGPPELGGFPGSKPLRNAVRKPGEWNSYDVLFRAPRFDKSGKKTENARFFEVRLNGVVIQKDVEMTGPTGGPLEDNEVAKGPVFFQADHGPVSLRNLWVKPLTL